MNFAVTFLLENDGIRFCFCQIGDDEREERSPSFFNQEECWTVMEYIDRLLNARGMIKVKPKQIGVISPYRKQVGQESMHFEIGRGKY